MSDDIPKFDEEEGGGAHGRRRPWADREDAEGRDVTLDKSAAGTVRAETAELKMSAAGVLKTESANLTMSAAGFAYAKDDMNLNWSSANVLAAGSEVRMQYAAGKLVAAGGRIRLSNALAGALLTGSAHVEGGYIGLLVAGKADLAEGTKVLLQPSGAAAMGAGFAGGLLLAGAFLWKFSARSMKRRGAVSSRFRKRQE